MRLLVALVAVTIVSTVTGCGTDPTPTPRPACPTEAPTRTGAQAALEDGDVATITVSGAAEGSFSFELLGDEAPIAAANFANLARCGFYDGVTFHRVLSGFVIQAGDPQTRENRGDFDGLGTGGPGYAFEIEPPADERPFDAYTVAMANDRLANRSQFFVTLADLDEALRSSGVYTIFGEVVEGTETVDAIAAVPVTDPRIGLPVDPVIIERIVIGQEQEDGE